MRRAIKKGAREGRPVLKRVRVMKNCAALRKVFERFLALIIITADDVCTHG